MINPAVAAAADNNNNNGSARVRAPSRFAIVFLREIYTYTHVPFYLYI